MSWSEKLSIASERDFFALVIAISLLGSVLKPVLFSWIGFFSKGAS